MCWTSLYGHASFMHTALHSALCFTIERVVQYGSNKVFFWGVNEGQVTLFSFPKEASTRQKLMRSCFLWIFSMWIY